MPFRRSSRFGGARPSVTARILRAVWFIVRLLLVSGGVMGPAPPPPPLPAPPPIESAAKDGQHLKKK